MNSEVWLIFQNDQILLRNNSEVDLFPPAASILPLKNIFIRQHCLGQINGKVVYCAEFPPTAAIPADMIAVPLKKTLHQLETHWFNPVVKAYLIIHWDKNHQFCGRCGHATTHSAHAFERVCSQCSLLFYPRISPSMIVLIYQGDHILMARGHHFPPGAYGLIAGFIEAGENIEQAVYREVKEEVNINIKNLRYFGSQPWPFPDSLMIGFIAEYASGELTPNSVELEQAGWYHYEQIPGRPSSKISIANQLIDYFIDQKRKGLSYGSL
ncbi:MAG: NAD(+) diphosphatase [Gammaproteobacteria bacterium]|nr:MAG: NAD(+) diphosphatase [Gammaproteobacteria bacterium]